MYEHATLISEETCFNVVKEVVMQSLDARGLSEIKYTLCWVLDYQSSSTFGHSLPSLSWQVDKMLPHKASKGLGSLMVIDELDGKDIFARFQGILWVQHEVVVTHVDKTFVLEPSISVTFHFLARAWCSDEVLDGRSILEVQHVASALGLEFFFSTSIANCVRVHKICCGHIKLFSREEFLLDVHLGRFKVVVSIILGFGYRDKGLSACYEAIGIKDENQFVVGHLIVHSDAWVPLLLVLASITDFDPLIKWDVLQLPGFIIESS